MLIKYADEREVFDELADQVADCVGHAPKAATWGRYVEKWLRVVDELASTVPVPDIPTPQEAAKLRGGLTNSVELSARLKQRSSASRSRTERSQG